MPELTFFDYLGNLAHVTNSAMERVTWRQRLLVASTLGVGTNVVKPEIGPGLDPLGWMFILAFGEVGYIFCAVNVRLLRDFFYTGD